MESLLSVSFDNIASKDGSKIRKGIRQIEGLVAQICLQKPSRSSPHKRKSSAIGGKHEDSVKGLRDLKDDPAFREFFRLQEGFQWNVASRLISTLERLLGMGNPSQTDLLIHSSLSLLQGILLLHPPSRSLFSREIYMNTLLDLLDASNPPEIQSQTLLVLVTALLDTPSNTRTFEEIDGLLTVTSLFKARSTTREVKMRALEFLYFYLMPEAPAEGKTRSTSAPNTAMGQRSPSKKAEALAGHARTHSGDSGGMDGVDGLDIRDQAEKQRMLGQYLSNVAELVEDLNESAPFGQAA